MLRALRAARDHIRNIATYGEWSCGCERYAGKPRFGPRYAYYDGHHLAFHLGPLWVGVDY